MRHSLGAFASLAALGFASAAQADNHQDAPRISDIEARLFYEQSGTLSEDITASDDFIARNIIIGAGSAAENANDLMIVAVLSAGAETFTPAPLLITVYSDNGETLAQRIIDGLLLEQGETHRAIMLEDAGCAGPISIVVKFGFEQRTEALNLNCGE